VSKDEIDFVIGAQIGQPVPAEDTFDADNDIFDKGKHQFKIAFRIGFDVQVDDHFALTVQDADIHGPLKSTSENRKHDDGFTQRPRFLGRP
jgi:hypothetical protein